MGKQYEKIPFTFYCLLCDEPTFVLFFSFGFLLFLCSEEWKGARDQDDIYAPWAFEEIWKGTFILFFSLPGAGCNSATKKRKKIAEIHGRRSSSGEVLVRQKTRSLTSRQKLNSWSRTATLATPLRVHIPLCSGASLHSIFRAVSPICTPETITNSSQSELPKITCNTCLYPCNVITRTGYISKNRLVSVSPQLP